MRELKFRAWDKVEDKYVAKDFHIIGEDFLFDLFQSRPIQAADRLHIQQYTGVDDKNSQPIYEGDILKFSKCFGFNSINKERLYVVVWNKKLCNWRLVDDGIYIMSPEKQAKACWAELSELKATKCQVVGNICENYDLLI